MNHCTRVSWDLEKNQLSGWITFSARASSAKVVWDACPASYCMDWLQLEQVLFPCRWCCAFALWVANCFSFVILLWCTYFSWRLLSHLYLQILKAPAPKGTLLKEPTENPTKNDNFIHIKSFIALFHSFHSQFVDIYDCACALYLSRSSYMYMPNGWGRVCHVMRSSLPCDEVKFAMWWGHISMM